MGIVFASHTRRHEVLFPGVTSIVTWAYNPGAGGGRERRFTGLICQST